MNITEISTFATGAAFLSHWCVSGLTLASPNRPSWVAFLASAVCSVVFTFLLTLANVPGPYTTQLVAQMVLTGLLGAAGAAGTGVTQASAEAKRAKAQRGRVHAEPDPLTPQARVEP